MDMAIWEVILRIGLSVVVGGAVGMQREYKKGASAGLRTHILVSLGACIAMLTNAFFLDKYGKDATDITRMAAGVISGIGFLGAGSIIKDGVRVRGLTTAAGLWVVACLGITAGAGFYLAAGVGTALVVIVIWSLKGFERLVIKKKSQSLIILKTINDPNKIIEIMQTFSQLKLAVSSMDIDETDEGAATVSIVAAAPEAPLAQLTGELAKIKQIRVISIDRMD